MEKLLAPQRSSLYIIVCNKLRNVICTVCITGRRGVEGTIKVFANNLTLWADLWDERDEEILESIVINSSLYISVHP